MTNQTQPADPQPAAETPAPQSVPAELIEALTTREACLANVYMSAAQATNQHLDWVASGCYTKEERQAAIANEKRLLELGNQYFAEGYRLKKSPRQMRGTFYSVPSEAIVHDLQSAGHIAMTEAFRVVYVIKK